LCVAFFIPSDIDKCNMIVIQKIMMLQFTTKIAILSI
jgi:hypothetical protein